MTTQTQISRPAPFIEDIGKDFAKSLIGVTGLPALATDISGQLTKRTIQDPEDASKFRLETDEELANRQQIARERFQTFEQTKAGQAPFAPEVAPQDDLQLEAAKLAKSGIGSYQDFLDAAGTQFGKAAEGIAGAEALLGAGAGTGTGSIQDFMSPYQSQVIDATLGEFDRQRQIQEQRIKDQQAALGVLGAGRAGVQLSEFGTGSARERALLEAGLLQQGFQEAVARRQQDMANRQGLAQSRLGLGQFQTGLAGLQPSLQRADISTLGSVGAVQQAQAQAQLEAQRQANQLAAFEPQTRLDTYGRGITQLISGYPASGSQFTQTPNLSPLETALGFGLGVADIFGKIRGNK